MEAALTSFSLGLLAMSSPCVLPLYPGYLAYLSARTEESGLGRLRYALGFFVLAGVLSMMIVLGGIIALLAVSIGRALAYVIPLADAAILILGLLLIANRNPFSGLRTLRVPVLRHPVANAYAYGLLYGPIVLPCSGPLVVAIFALSFTAAEAIDKVWIFLWFGVGFGLPLLVLSLLSGALARWITVFLARHSRAVNLVGGVMLVAVAIYDFSQNWEFIKLYHGL